MKSVKRCTWAGTTDSTYIAYHDLEWGVPIKDDIKLFEFMVLESAQAGLSWRTILNRRKGYEKLFKQYDPKKVAKMTEKDVERLMGDASIIRNRAKIKATINNAKRFLEVQKEFGSFSAYMWSWVKNKPIQNKWTTDKQLPAVTELAIAMANDLKKRGFSFLGPTVWYAHMQAVGMVNDHQTNCFRHREIKKLSPREPLTH
jgi:DNA-3-methyladenine glycosylase I